MSITLDNLSKPVPDDFERNVTVQDEDDIIDGFKRIYIGHVAFDKNLIESIEMVNDHIHIKVANKLYVIQYKGDDLENILKIIKEYI